MFSKQDQSTWPRPPRRYRKYGFKDLQVGETLTVPPVDENGIGCRDIVSFRALVWNTAKRLGYVLSCRQLENGNFEVYRSK